MRRIVIVMLSLVFLGVTTCGSVGYAKEASYVDNIYEKEGYSYLEITLETEGDIFKDKELLDIVEFKTYLGKKYTSSVTHNTLHPTTDRDTAFLNEIDQIIKYHTLVSEYEDLKKRAGGNAVEQEVLKELKAEKYKDVVDMEVKYGSTICKVPKDLTIVLTTKEYIAPVKEVKEVKEVDNAKEKAIEVGLAKLGLLWGAIIGMCLAIMGVGKRKTD